MQIRHEQKLLAPAIVIQQLDKAPGLLCLIHGVLVTPAIIRRLRQLDDTAALEHGLALICQ